MKSSKILGTMLFLFFLFFAFSSVWSQQVMQARIHLANKEQMKEVLRLNLDIAYVKYGQYVDIITDREEVDQLRSSGYDVEIVHEGPGSFLSKQIRQK